MNESGGGEGEEGATRFEQLYKAISGLPINIVKADLHRSKVDHACVCVYIYIGLRFILLSSILRTWCVGQLHLAKSLGEGSEMFMNVSWD